MNSVKKQLQSKRTLLYMCLYEPVAISESILLILKIFINPHFVSTFRYTILTFWVHGPWIVRQFKLHSKLQTFLRL